MILLKKIVRQCFHFDNELLFEAVRKTIENTKEKEPRESKSELQHLAVLLKNSLDFVPLMV